MWLHISELKTNPKPLLLVANIRPEDFSSFALELSRFSPALQGVGNDEMSLIVSS